MGASRILALTIGASVAIGACSSQESEPKSTTVGGATSTSGSGGTLPEPRVHRPIPQACAGMPPMGSPSTDPGGACMQDSDCTGGDNGRCVWPFGGTNVCMYDECSADADCGGASVCVCRLEESYGFNRCFQGNCQLDRDCPGSYCSPSAVHIYPSCMTGISPGSIGFFCHTPLDECVDDTDCGQPDTATCIFSVDAARWVCQELLCTG